MTKILSGDNAEIKLEEDNTAANTQVGEIKAVGVASSTADNAIEQSQLSGHDLFSEFKGKLIFANTSGSPKKVRLRVSSINGAAIEGVPFADGQKITDHLLPSDLHFL